MFIDLQLIKKNLYFYRLHKFCIDDNYWDGDSEFLKELEKRLDEEEREYFTSCEDIRILITLHLKAIKGTKATSIKVEPTIRKDINEREFYLFYKLDYKIEGKRYNTELNVQCSVVDNPLFEFCPDTDIPEVNAATSLCRSMKYQGKEGYACITRASLIAKYLMDRDWKVASSDYYKFDDNSFRIGFTLVKNRARVQFDGYEVSIRVDNKYFTEHPKIRIMEPNLKIYEFAEDADCIAMNKKDIYNLIIRYKEDGEDSSYIKYYVQANVQATIGNTIEYLNQSWKNKRYWNGNMSISDSLPKGYIKAEIQCDDKLVAECESKDIGDPNNWKIL